MSNKSNLCERAGAPGHEKCRDIIAESAGFRSNQQTLGNGCVCDSGCDQCDRLAEAWTAMRQAILGLMTSMSDFHTPKQREQACAYARTALAQAEKVKP